MNLAVPPDSTDPPGADLVQEKVSEVGDDSGLTKVVLVEDLKKGDPSWISIAQEKQCLKKYEVEVTSKDGKHKVVIPDEILSDSTPIWDDFVFGKFLDAAPHIAKVHMVVNKIWSYGDLNSKVEVFDVNPTTMRFKITNQKAREKVIKRGMWNIAGVPMIVKKWSPSTEEEKQEEEAIPMWVHMRKVPLHLFSWEALSFMTSTVGYPVRLHPETAACSNFDEAKIFVKVDVSKPLPKEIDFTMGGKEFTAEFYYPWLPSRCNSCNKWGHTDKVCVKNRVKSSGRKSASKREVGKSSEEEMVSAKRSLTLSEAVAVESDSNKLVISPERSTDTGEEVNKENVWSNVSPD